MTGWELFVGALDNCMPVILLWLLFLCIVGLIRELTRREHDEGG